MIKHRLNIAFKTPKFRKIILCNRVKKIALFGSQIFESKSNDYDFLVEFKDKADLLDHIGLKQDLEKYLKKKVDVVTKNSLSKYFRAQVLKEAIYLDV